MVARARREKEEKKKARAMVRRRRGFFAVHFHKTCSFPLTGALASLSILPLLIFRFSPNQWREDRALLRLRRFPWYVLKENEVERRRRRRRQSIGKEVTFPSSSISCGVKMLFFPRASRRL